MAKIRITLIGLGDTGRAIARGLKDVIREAEIVGHDKNLGTMRKAETDKLVDKTAINLFSALDGAAMVVLAIPLDELVTTLKLIGKDAPRGALMVDVSSSKTAALRAAGAIPADVAYLSTSITFVPAQPESAGTHGVPTRSLRGATWAITPRSGTAPGDINQFTSIVTAAEAAPLFMDAAEHDGLLLAAHSVPAAVAAALLDSVAGDPAWRERKWLAGDALYAATAGLEHVTSAALASALLEQPDAARHWLNQIMLKLIALRDAVDAGDAAGTRALVDRAVEQRDRWLAERARGRDTGAPEINVTRPTLVNALLGDRLAERLRGPKGKA